MQPLLWFIPDYIRQGLTVENMFENFPYHGIKLHPRAHNWDLNDSKHLDCLHSIFGYADVHKLPVTIHTGEGECEKPYFFESFFAVYVNAKIILAHCRPADDTIIVFKKYPHLRGDTAFAPQERIQAIVNSGFSERLLAGTDFPITHYFSTKYAGEEKSLSEQYQEDCTQLDTIKFAYQKIG
jgi:predicted TIM-barrel fold metal-dependent hydrolase